MKTPASPSGPSCGPRLSLPASLLASLAAALLGCSKPEAPPAAPEPSVAGNVLSFPEQKTPLGVSVVQVGESGQNPLVVPGRLIWDEDHTARVYAPYAGRIERLRVAVGETVQRGQPLADLSSADIGQAQADLHKGQADLALSQSALQRARELAEGGVIARKELQQAEAEHARAQAETMRARARLSQYGVATQGVTQGLALTAPLAGTVVERNGNARGEVRTDVQGPPLFVISNTDTLWALLDVDETQLTAFKPGDDVELRVAAWPEREFRASVLSVADTVDPTTRTVKVRLRVPNRRHELKAEMFVNATVQQPVALPLVPADAVFLRGEKSYIFVQSAPGRYERREVMLREAGPLAWKVLQGVNKGEEVVVGGGLYFNQLLDAPK